MISSLLKEINECYKKAKENHNSVCTTRSQLLYFALKNKGFQPKIIRYLTSETQNKRKEFTLLSGEKVESHVVVLLYDKILDSNLPKVMSKKDYEQKLNKKNPEVKVFSVEYWLDPSKYELIKICEDCKLSKSFRDAVENFENLKQ